MQNDKQKSQAETIDKLKALRDKTKNEEIKQSIATKIDGTKQPFNK
jgi:hypothetical protein